MKPPPSILAVDQYAVMGGGQRLLLDIVRDQLRSGVHVSVALPSGGPVADACLALGAAFEPYALASLPAGAKSFLSVARYLLRSLATSRQIARIARVHEAQLLFANGPRCVLPVVWAARRSGLPVVAAVHLIHEGFAERQLLTRCFRSEHVKAVTFCSKVAQAPFEHSLGTKGRVLWNWVSDEFLERPKERGARRAIDGLDESAIVVGVLGRISRNKGQIEMLLGLRDRFSDDPQLHLAIAGSADFEDAGAEQELEALVRASGLESRVHLLGAVNDSVAFLDALDILAVPSQWEEPFGLVAIEGMARSLPVVAARSGGLVEIVVDGQTGRLTGKAPAALGEAVIQLVRDPALRQAQGEEGRRRVESLFRAGGRMEKIRQLFSSAAADRGP